MKRLSVTGLRKIEGNPRHWAMLEIKKYMKKPEKYMDSLVYRLIIDHEGIFDPETIRPITGRGGGGWTIVGVGGSTINGMGIWNNFTTVAQGKLNTTSGTVRLNPF